MARPLIRALVQLRSDDSVLRSEMPRHAATAGAAAGRSGSQGFLRSFTSGIRGGIRQALNDDGSARREGQSAGRSYSEGLKGALRSGLATAGGIGGGAARGAGGILSAILPSAAMLKAGGVALGAGILVAVKSGLQTAASNEQSLISFETLLGSKSKAQGFFKQLQQFAAVTPFELPGVVDAAKQLLGVGSAAKDVIPTLTAYGDTSAALGLSQEQFGRVMLATTQIMANGKVNAGDLLQITEAGIPIWKLLAEATGKPVPELRKLMESGKLLASDVLPKLQKQMEKDYGGAMAKQSQTLAGVWSTVKDTISQALAQALTPLEPLLAKILPPAATAFASAVAGISDAFVRLAPLIAAGLDVLKPAADVLKSLGGSLLDRLSGLLPGNTPDRIAAAMKPAEAGTKAGNALTRAFAAAIDPSKAGARLATATRKALTPPPPPKLASLQRGLVDRQAGASAGFGIFTPIITAAQQFGSRVMPALSKAFGSIQKFVTDLLPVFEKFGSELLAKIGPALDDIGSIISDQLVPAFQAFLPAVTPLVTFLLDTFGGQILSAISGAINIVKGALVILAGIFNVVAGLLTGDWSRLWEGIKQIFSGAWEALKGLFQLAFSVWLPGVFRLGGRLMLSAARGGGTLIVAFFRRLPGLLLSALGKLGSLLSGKGRELLGGLGSGAKSAAGAVFGWLGDLGVTLISKVGDLSYTLYAAGKALMRGLLDGILAAWHAVQDFIGGIAGYIASHKGPLSYDRTLLIPHGRAIMAGLAEGMKIDPVASAVDDINATIAGVGTNVPAQGVSTPTRDSVRLHPDDLAALVKALSSLTVRLSTGELVGAIDRRYGRK